MDFYAKKMLNEVLTWKKCYTKAIISQDIEVTYADLYKLICINAAKINKKNKIFAIHNSNNFLLIVDVLSVLLTGNTVLIIPNYILKEDIEKIAMDCDAIKYKNSDMEKILYNLKLNEFNDIEKFEINNSNAIIMYSSGTTSISKAIQITYESLYYRIVYTDKYFERTEGKAELFLMPLSCALGLQHQLFPCLAKKCTIVLYENILNPRKIVNLVHKYNISYLSMVPSVLKCILKYCVKKGDNLSCVEKIFICGEKVYANFLVKVYESFKTTKVFQAYGMSEMLPVSIQFYQNKEEIVEHCVGKILDEIEVKILDADVNGIGEICIRGKNMINKYYKAKEEFSWIQTGDIGYIDDNNLLYILGRKKNMVIISGNNIYIEEIERVAEAYSGIEEARAVGENDELRGEVINLYVRQQENGEIKIRVEELRKYIYTQLNIYNIPLNIQLVDKIEQTQIYKRKRR